MMLHPKPKNKHPGYLMDNASLIQDHILVFVIPSEKKAHFRRVICSIYLTNETPPVPETDAPLSSGL